MSLKRINTEVSCVFCGASFKQTRWWQTFCSDECRKKAEKTAKRRIKELLDENRNLKNRIIELEKNALDHSRGPRRFKYDDENQEYDYGARG